jgi:hypothetical protein
VVKRALWVAVLGGLVGAGCKPAAAPAAALDLVRTSPEGLLARGVPTGSEVDVVGLVKELREDSGRLGVTFATRDPSRAVRCQVEAHQATAAGKLRAGQLAAMQGLSRGGSGKDAVLEQCRVAWAGPLPGAAPMDGRDASRAARSLEVCRVPVLVDGLRRAGRQLPDGKPFTEAAFRQQEPARVAPLDAAEKRARAQLATEGLTALSCDHPLVQLLARCEPGAGTPGVECDTPVVKELLALLVP